MSEPEKLASDFDAALDHLARAYRAAVEEAERLRQAALERIVREEAEPLRREIATLKREIGKAKAAALNERERIAQRIEAEAIENTDEQVSLAQAARFVRELTRQKPREG